MSSGTKSVSKSVSLEPELWEKVESKSKVRHGGNRSAFVRELALADLEGSFDPATAGANVILELTRRFHPTLADELNQQLDPAINEALGSRRPNQTRIIARFLEALCEALKESFDPEAKFELVDRKQIKAMGQVSDSHLLTLAELLAQKVREHGAAGMFTLNESPPASLPSKPPAKPSKPQLPRSNR